MRSYPEIKNRKIRMAILGCGRISRNHFASIEEHKNEIELISICESKNDILKDH